MNKLSENVKLQKEPETVEAIIDLLRYLLGSKLADLVAVIDLTDFEASGVIIQPNPEDSYVEELPFGGGRHLILSLSDLPTNLKPGFHELETS